MISGIVPIKASSGHWAITAIILDFAKVRSVATHSWGITSPPLDDDLLITRGAGHYENGCLPCHGGPGRVIPPVMAAMTPTPPELRERLSRWRPEELFSIVKHGIKFTGMPAWPAQQRDDEVWAIVAFLRRLPELDASAYQRLGVWRGQCADGLSRHASRRRHDATSGRSRCVLALSWGERNRQRAGSVSQALPGNGPSISKTRCAPSAIRTRFSGMMGEIAAQLSDERDARHRDLLRRTACAGH